MCYYSDNKKSFSFYPTLAHGNSHISPTKSSLENLRQRDCSASSPYQARDSLLLLELYLFPNHNHFITRKFVRNDHQPWESMRFSLHQQPRDGWVITLYRRVPNTLISGSTYFLFYWSYLGLEVTPKTRHKN